MLFQHRAITALLAISGAIGLLLACVGLYGVMSYAVARRTHELGVRSALGARRTDIVGLVMREGAAVTLLGMAIGGFLTFAALRVGANAPIRPDLDGATVVAVSLALAAAVFAACYIPARRAARVDPLESLRAL
jgi:putative ABC transport system permease protein